MEDQRRARIPPQDARAGSVLPQPIVRLTFSKTIQLGLKSKKELTAGSLTYNSWSRQIIEYEREQKAKAEAAKKEAEAKAQQQQQQ